MPEATDDIPVKVIEAALKGSGFPFQTAVRHVIGTHKSPRYTIHASEYPWLNRKNEHDFLDLVAASSQLVLTIECKKTKQEKYIFLLPEGAEHTGDVQDFRCCNIVYYNEPERAARAVCQTVLMDPGSPVSEFCVVSTNSRERMLERDAAMLVNATDEFVRDKQERPKLGLVAPYVVVPVLVTNAKLYKARYDPEEVSLLTGEMDKVRGNLEPAQWIRFHKSFVAGYGRDLGLRSIFVVNASSLTKFLSRLEQAIGEPSRPNPVGFR